MTSYPVVDEGQQKQDVFYRDNANNGVIMEENALHHHISSSDQRNVTLSSFLNLFPAHARVARQSNLCDGNTRVLVACDDRSSLTQVSCRDSSFACSSRQGKCVKKYTACTIKGKLTDVVTGCDCL